MKFYYELLRFDDEDNPYTLELDCVMDYRKGTNEIDNPTTCAIEFSTTEDDKEIELSDNEREDIIDAFLKTRG